MTTPLLRRFLPAILLFSLMAISCRENVSSFGPSTALRYRPSFRTGDVFRYSLYDISPSGYVIQSSRRRSLWTVVATSAHRNGREGVMVIADSTADTRTDTVFCRFEPGGDAYLYGFLSTIAALRSDTTLPRTWDRVAAFTLGPLVQWRVGSMDSSGGSPVYGEIRDGLEYVSTTVDGVSIVFPAYRVDFTGDGVDATIWFAENPPCLAVQVVSFWMETTGRGRWIEGVTRGSQDE
jgi:hypothetical protein